MDAIEIDPTPRAIPAADSGRGRPKGCMFPFDKLTTVADGVGPSFLYDGKSPAHMYSIAKKRFGIGIATRRELDESGKQKTGSKKSHLLWRVWRVK